MTTGAPATEDVFGQLAAMRVVPVVVLDDSAAAAPLADALTNAGLPCAEITLRRAAGEAAIRIMAQQRDLLVGAGMVLDAIQAERSAEAVCLGLEVEGTDGSLSTLPAEGFKAMIEQAVAAYPNFQVIATTLAAVKTATVNDWSAIAWSRSGGFAESTRRPGLEILDRVGGGDSFAAGLIFGLLNDLGLHLAIEYGAAHDALAMTTPGDTSTARREEVDNLIGGAGARADR